MNEGVTNKTLTKCVFFLGREVYQKIDALAMETDRSRSEIVRGWIRELEELRIKKDLIKKTPDSQGSGRR